jgi:hypothetical protein
MGTCPTAYKSLKIGRNTRECAMNSTATSDLGTLRTVGAFVPSNTAVIADVKTPAVSHVSGATPDVPVVAGFRLGSASGARVGLTLRSDDADPDGVNDGSFDVHELVEIGEFDVSTLSDALANRFVEGDDAVVK